MSRYDLLLRQGSLVTEAGVGLADIAVADSRIVAIGPELAGEARQVIDAAGLHLLPGLIDAHVHFNEPGRAAWEGFQSGSRALAAGGGTVACDMPLNAHPPTLDAASFRAKRTAAESSSTVDFALWGGLVPGNRDRLDELAAAGVVGLKAFMANSGIDDFPAVDDDALSDGMVRAAALGLIVAVHAESEAITSRLAAQARAEGRTSIRDFLRSRPAIAETAAITRALQMAEEIGCALHVVHVSTGQGVALVAEAKARGIDVSCETCPHYLILSEEDAERLGAVAKCAPPLRPAAEREALWAALAAGDLPMVASDHSPAPATMKTGDDFFAVWGGIAGCQTALPLLLDDGFHRRGVPLPTIVAATAGFVARRFRLPGKGRLAVGDDADLALVELAATHVLRAEDLYYRHRQSPFLGRSLRGRVVRTIRRGETIFELGRDRQPSPGRLLQPVPAKPRSTRSGAAG